VIRKANDNDVESIAHINSTVWQISYKGAIDNNFIEKRTVEKCINIFRNVVKTEDIYVFEESNVIKGFASGKTTNDKYDCEILALYVGLEHQGGKIGTKLLEHMKLYYKNKTCKDMVIWTIKGLRNNGFYKKHGGKIKEEKELELGDRKYPGIGFVFKL